MAVLYRLSQNKMSTSKAKGKWFAQAVMTGTIDTDALAEIMQRNCTVKKAIFWRLSASSSRLWQISCRTQNALSRMASEPLSLALRKQQEVQLQQPSSAQARVGAAAARGQI